MKGRVFVCNLSQVVPSLEHAAVTTLDVSLVEAETQKPAAGPRQGRNPTTETAREGGTENCKISRK